MQILFFLIVVILVIVVILLVVAMYVQSQQTVNRLADRIAALEAANRKSLNHYTADELMAASYALNLFRKYTDLLDNADGHIERALHPEKYTKK